MVLDAGAVVAGYTIEAVLGSGGMGTVYRARHPKLPRSDALKVLSAELSQDPHFRSRFEREAELAATLDHPNIVTIYDRGDTDGHLWIAMQYVAGSDAEKELRAGRMTPERAVQIISEVAKALDYAHRRHLLHRDVKPANFLLAPDDERIFLADFGIARAIDEAVGLTQTGMVMASVAYAAPETLSGQPVDHRADIYSLGCSFFRLLTGKAPYSRSGGMAGMAAAHLTAPPPRVTELAPALPSALDAVLAIAMAKDPSQRYPTARAFAEAAGQALDQTTSVVRAAPTPPAPPPSDGRSGHSWPPAPSFPSAPNAAGGSSNWSDRARTYSGGQFGATGPLGQFGSGPGYYTGPPPFVDSNRRGPRNNTPWLVAAVAAVLVVAVVTGGLLYWGLSSEDDNEAAIAATTTTTAPTTTTTTTSPAAAATVSCEGFSGGPSARTLPGWTTVVSPRGLLYDIPPAMTALPCGTLVGWEKPCPDGPFGFCPVRMMSGAAELPNVRCPRNSLMLTGIPGMSNTSDIDEAVQLEASLVADIYTSKDGVAPTVSLSEPRRLTVAGSPAIEVTATVTDIATTDECVAPSAMHIMIATTVDGQPGSVMFIASLAQDYPGAPSRISIDPIIDTLRLADPL